MTELGEKLQENVLNGLYSEHPKGAELLELDLQETIKEACSHIHDEHEVLANKLKADNGKIQDEIDKLKEENQ